MSRRPIDPRTGIIGRGANRIAMGGRLSSEARIKNFNRSSGMAGVESVSYSVSEIYAANSFSALGPAGDALIPGGYTAVDVSYWFTAAQSVSQILIVSSATSSIVPPSGWTVVAAGRSGGSNNFWYSVLTISATTAGHTVVIGLPDLTPGWSWPAWPALPNKYGSFNIGLIRMTGHVPGTLGITSPILRGPGSSYPMSYPSDTFTSGCGVIVSSGAAAGDRFYRTYPDLGIEWTSQYGWGYLGMAGFQDGYFDRSLYTTFTVPSMPLPPSATVYSASTTDPPELNPPPFPGGTPISTEAVLFGMGWT